MSIPFSRPSISDREAHYLMECLEQRHLSGDGAFTKRCHAFLEAHYGATVLLTHSATAALEMGAILADIREGDEVIMPSFTFVSTANAVVNRGGVPVFIDVDPLTLNMEPTEIDRAVTSKTKAIFPVHYAGVGCDMTEIMNRAEAHGLIVVEDAAQGYLARRGDRALGTFGALGCLSFHATKNVVSGEGGALIINDPSLRERAHIIREKGTNRTSFLRREVTKYEWLDIGSSYLPSDLIAALLLAQLERAEEITHTRRRLWARYAHALRPLETDGKLRLTRVPQDAEHNGHIFFVMMPTPEKAHALRAELAQHEIGATSHYVPLHSAPAGRRFGRTVGDLAQTDLAAATLVRLPLYSDLDDATQDIVIAKTTAAVQAL
jgi:dTDP-4-amino-4,6-dideoxygalactose transaminase